LKVPGFGRSGGSFASAGWKGPAIVAIAVATLQLHRCRAQRAPLFKRPPIVTHALPECFQSGCSRKIRLLRRSRPCSRIWRRKETVIVQSMQCAHARWANLGPCSNMLSKKQPRDRATSRRWVRPASGTRARRAGYSGAGPCRFTPGSRWWSSANKCSRWASPFESALGGRKAPLPPPATTLSCPFCHPFLAGARKRHNTKRSTLPRLRFNHWEKPHAAGFGCGIGFEPGH